MGCDSYDQDAAAPDGDLVEALLHVLGQHDPEGLLDLGAPGDEYRPEATHLALLVSENRALTPQLVATVWHHWFGTASSLLTNVSPQECTRLAEHLEAAATTVRSSGP